MCNEFSNVLKNNKFYRNIITLKFMFFIESISLG